MFLLNATKKLACYAVYELIHGEWIDVYRSIDSERVRNKFRELRNNNLENQYKYVDEELGNSNVPF